MVSRWLGRLLGRRSPDDGISPTPTRGAGNSASSGTGARAGAITSPVMSGVAPVEKRVLVVVHDPVADTRSRRTLVETIGWNDPDRLASEYIRDLLTGSHGLLRYRIVGRVLFDTWPVKQDGFRYDAATFLECWQARRGFHEPDAVDYHALLRECDAIGRVNADAIDEVWFFGPPYAGYYESRMIGPGSYWCNSEGLAQVTGAPEAKRRFVVMGFNYERDVDCMLENLGHRTESMMMRRYDGRRDPSNLWDHFTRYDRIAPGQASVGNVHFAPNSDRDYDWGNYRPVSSDCDDWLRFPNLTGARRMVDCRDWGNGDMRRHHLWWFERLPHVAGESNGVSHNWWTFIADPNSVR